MAGRNLTEMVMMSTGGYSVISSAPSTAWSHVSNGQRRPVNQRRPGTPGRAAAEVGRDGEGSCPMHLIQDQDMMGHLHHMDIKTLSIALQVHDEHDHVRLSVDLNEFTNVQDSGLVPGCDIAGEAKENACAMSKLARRQMERNVHDINVCVNELKQHDHGNVETCEAPETCDLFHVSLEHGSCDVSEVFSMPRVLPIAERKGVTGMRSYDIGNGWNFLLESHRKKCREEISKHRRQVVLVVLLVVPFPK